MASLFGSTQIFGLIILEFCLEMVSRFKIQSEPGGELVNPQIHFYQDTQVLRETRFLAMGLPHGYTSIALQNLTNFKITLK